MCGEKRKSCLIQVIQLTVIAIHLVLIKMQPRYNYGVLRTFWNPWRSLSLLIIVGVSATLIVIGVALGLGLGIGLNDDSEDLTVITSTDNEISTIENTTTTIATTTNSSGTG